MISRSRRSLQSRKSWDITGDEDLWGASVSWTASCSPSLSGSSCQSTLPLPCTYCRGSHQGSDHAHAPHSKVHTLVFLGLIACVFPVQTFLVRKSRTSQKNVLCVRLEDDSIPSFVQQFGIVEEPSGKLLTLMRNWNWFILNGHQDKERAATFIYSIHSRTVRLLSSLSLLPPPALCLETSAISFPDLPRLIAFYCVSR